MATAFDSRPGLQRPSPRSLRAPLLPLLLLLLSALLTHSLSEATFSSRTFLRSAGQVQEGQPQGTVHQRRGDQEIGEPQRKGGKPRNGAVRGGEGEGGSSAHEDREKGRGGGEWGARRELQSVTDPCAGMPAKLAADGLSYFVPPSALRACLDTVPLETDKVQQDIESVKLYFKNFYGSLRVGEHAPNYQVPSYYDVIKELDKYLANFSTEKSSPRAYETLFQIIYKLHDGHTFLNYGWQIQHLFTYNLVGVVEGDSTVVRVAPQTMQSPDQLDPVFKADPRFYGAKVLTINGQDPWNFTLMWAYKLSGGYLNLGQRLNSAFGARAWGRDTSGSPFWANRVGDFCGRSLPLWPTLLDDVQTNNPVDSFTMTVELPNGKTLESPKVTWMSQIPASTFDMFSSSSALRKQFWKPLGSSGDMLLSEEMRLKFPTQNTLNTQTHPFLKNFQHPPRALFKAAVSLSPFSRAQQISKTTDFWPVFLLDDGKTAVVVISSFDTTTVPVPKEVPSEYVSQYQNIIFLNESMKAFNTANSAGASQVIIDIRSNGGGTVSMGNFFVEMLMGTKALGGQTQLLVGNLRSDTEFVQLLVKKKYGWYDSEGYLNLDEKPFTGKEGDTFFYPLQNKTYGKHGVPGVYSSYFKDGDYANDRKNALTVLYGKGVKEITPILGEKPFILLSDGLCFSTCMNFAYTMRTAFNATIVLVGGYPGNPFQVAGGGVAFISPSVTRAFYNTWASDKEVASNPEAPKAFVGPIDMSMQTANGFVPVNATAPIEFNFLKANGWIMYNITRLMDDSIIWAQTAGGFKVVKK